MFCLGGFCPGGFWQGVFCPGGFCLGVYVRGVFVRGGVCPRTFSLEAMEITCPFLNITSNDLLTASSAYASCFSKTPPCPTLKNGRQPAKCLPENVRFTTSLLRLAAGNSSSEYISQTTKNSGEILKQLDSQGIGSYQSINIFGRSVADVHKKASWLGRIEWHLWCML